MIEKPHRRSKLTLFSALVLFVFSVLIIAAIFAGIIAFFLAQYGVLGKMLNSRFPIWIVVLLGPSIVIGMVLTLLSGRRPLRPFHQMIRATEEIAAGNFSVRLPIAGPKEVCLLNQSFNNMARELGSIETLRNDFVSNISHEFKTPVVSIKGFAKLLKKENLPPERRREYLDIIIAESERLAKLSSNVLLLSKLESQESAGETGPFSLDEQIRRSVLLLEPQCRQKQLSLNIELEPVEISASEELLHHVWLNLLGNAVKFTEPGGEISVSLRQKDDWAAVSVTDQGVGMEPEVRQRLFDKFYQGDSSRTTEGNGLGLSLVQRIVDLSGGSVEVESEPGNGSCFTVTLPLREPEKQGAPTRGA